MILLVGPPGAGKSTFCEQAVIQGLAVDRPIIYVNTERGPSKSEAALRERGLAEIEPGLLSFVDSYNETVGVPVSDRPDTIHADCNDLSSIDIAISKLSERIGKKGVLLVFDSLTSPYLFSGSEILRFMRSTLSKFAAEENSVLACIDEGCGKSEDLVAMMSLSNGVIKIETKEDKQLFNVVKHPRVRPTRIEVPTTEIWKKKIWDPKFWDREAMISIYKMIQGRAGAPIRREVGDYVNVFWLNFAQWSGMLWDPKRFPEMAYGLTKKHGASMRELVPLLPWRMRLLIKLFLPKNFSKVKDMKKALKFLQSASKELGSGIEEYLDDVSKTDEHYVRVHESSDCWGFENVDAAMDSYNAPMTAGFCKGLEKEERDWNAVETKCIGLGDPHCEFKLVPGEIDELRGSLEKDSSVVERIHDRLMHRLMGFLIDGKPLVERPRLGSGVRLNVVFNGISIPAMAGERYRMALRMGGARAGKEVGEHLMDAGIGEDEAVKRILNFLEHCRVGKVKAGETIRIDENYESLWYKFFTMKPEEPSCYFTTGFLNGFFSAVKNQHVKETKCVAVGDPYCEWEFT